MAPATHQEYIIILITFDADLSPESPRISCGKTPNSARGHNMQRDWFIDAMAREGDNVCATTKVRFVEWNIVTGDTELFTLHDCRYDEAMVIMGGEYTSWVFYQFEPTHPQIDGYDTIPSNYCSCCIYKQYKEIFQQIRDIILKT